MNKKIRNIIVTAILMTSTITTFSTISASAAEQGVNNVNMNEVSNEYDNDLSNALKKPSTKTQLNDYIFNMKYNRETVINQKGEKVTIDRPKQIINGTKSLTSEFDVITREKVTTKNFKPNSFAIMDDVKGIAYPGSLLLGNSDLADGRPSPISVPRKKIQLSIDIPIKKGQSSSVEVDPSSYGKVQDGINKLLSRASGKDVAARITMNSEIASSEKQLEASLGLTYSQIAKLKVDFKAIQSGKKKSMIMTYKQTYYTVNTKLPNTPGDLFGDGVTSSLLKKKGVNNANPPVIVSSVDYGRVVYVNIESDYNSDDVSAALNAAYAGFSGNINAKYKKILDNCKYTVFILGGSAGKSGKLLNIKSYNDFVKAVTSENKFNKNTCAYPIGYSSRFLKDNALAHSNMSTDYVDVNVTRQRKVQVKLISEGIACQIHQAVFKIKGKQITGYDKKGQPIYKDWELNQQLSGSSESSTTIDIPANLDYSTVTISIGYNGTNQSSRHDRICEYNLDEIPSNLVLKVNGWWAGFGYDVRGRIWKNVSDINSSKTYGDPQVDYTER